MTTPRPADLVTSANLPACALRGEIQAGQFKTISRQQRMFTTATSPPTARPSLRFACDARWVKPELVMGVRHIRGAGALRHATVKELRDG
jgi:hypothetical protein